MASIPLKVSKPVAIFKKEETIIKDEFLNRELSWTEHLDIVAIGKSEVERTIYKNFTLGRHKILKKNTPNTAAKRLLRYHEIKRDYENLNKKTGHLHSDKLQIRAQEINLQLEILDTKYSDEMISELEYEALRETIDMRRDLEPDFSIEYYQKREKRKERYHIQVMKVLGHKSFIELNSFLKEFNQDLKITYGNSTFTTRWDKKTRTMLDYDIEQETNTAKHKLSF